MRDSVVLIFYFVTLACMFISGYLVSRHMEQNLRMEKVYSKLDYVFDNYNKLNEELDLIEKGVK